ncbi:hypothetical protein OH807_00750 [Kitasatospora sp. NBC_01560]|uniref:hypothetical protein n=1 Tax=Kitasatospora sp. NBC_01560 TaxID=2975965 RepID=UPI00386B45CE
MTPSPLSWLPLPCSPDRAEDELASGSDDQALDPVLPAALHRGSDAGEAAAAWVRELAGRQCEEEHARALGRVAEAITWASSREIIPGSEGLLAEELRYTLAADVVLGASHTTGTLPELHAGERAALVTACALAAALPSCVLGDLERELTVLAEVACAAEAGRLATAAGDARALPVPRQRTLGQEHGDPLDCLAYRRVAESAAAAFAAALHYQGGRDEEACA